MKLNKKQEVLLNKLQVLDITKGLSSDEVYRRRNAIIGSSGSSDVVDDENNGLIYNVVAPPINCPAWVCCLLPCINHIASMKIYKEIYPEDANVLRNSKWILYDSTSLIVGDIIRIRVGDIIPADCIILGFYEQQQQQSSQYEEEEILVDTKYVTGYEKPISIIIRPDDNKLHQLYWGSRIVQARTSIVAVVTAIGSQTRVGQLIQQQQFPPRIINSLVEFNNNNKLIIPNDNDDDGIDTDHENDDGIALLSQQQQQQQQLSNSNHNNETSIV